MGGAKNRNNGSSPMNSDVGFVEHFDDEAGVLRC
jgi:hypothetical protein